MLSILINIFIRYKIDNERKKVSCAQKVSSGTIIIVVFGEIAIPNLNTIKNAHRRVRKEMAKMCAILNLLKRVHSRFFSQTHYFRT